MIFEHDFHSAFYSKAPIIRTKHWAVLAVHSVYCRTGISTGTYNRNFRVLRLQYGKIIDKIMEQGDLVILD